MVLYVDTFLLINFLFDFFILYIAGRLGGVRFSPIRLSLGALSASLYALASLLSGKALSSVPMRLLAAAFISFAAFGRKNFRGFFKQTALFLLCSAAMGGAAYSAAHLFGKSDAFGTALKFDFPVLYSLLGVFAVLLLCETVIGKLRKIYFSETFSIKITVEGKNYALTALYDSGNLAFDPLTALPLIISENVFTEVDIENARRIYLKTAAGEGFMPVIVPDKITIYQKNISTETKNAAVAVMNGHLSSDGSFNALIGGACLEGLEKHNAYTQKIIFRC